MWEFYYVQISWFVDLNLCFLSAGKLAPNHQTSNPGHQVGKLKFPRQPANSAVCFLEGGSIAVFFLEGGESHGFWKGVIARTKMALNFKRLSRRTWPRWTVKPHVKRCSLWVFLGEVVAKFRGSCRVLPELSRYSVKWLEDQVGRLEADARQGTSTAGSPFFGPLGGF